MLNLKLRCPHIDLAPVEHPRNLGKGRALKTGFAHIAERFPGADVVCADSDGQHRPVDIARVASALGRGDATIVLGARGLTGEVPLKSRFGNAMTRLAFRHSTGREIGDTQTGLRAYPASMLPWLQTIEGERFEYEMSVLLRAAEAGFDVTEIEIDTVYLDGNRSTHFRPLVDSARVYVPFLRFGLSSLFAFAIDVVLLLLLAHAFGHLLPAVVLARVCSSTVNFVVNRHLVFREGRAAGLGRSARRYVSLAICVLVVNYALLHVLHERLGLPLLAAKLVTEIALFVAGFEVQRKLVFARRRRRSLADRPVD